MPHIRDKKPIDLDKVYDTEPFDLDEEIAEFLKKNPMLKDYVTPKKNKRCGKRLSWVI